MGKAPVDASRNSVFAAFRSLGLERILLAGRIVSRC